MPKLDKSLVGSEPANPLRSVRPLRVLASRQSAPAADAGCCSGFIYQCVVGESHTELRLVLSTFVSESEARALEDRVE